MATLEKFEDFMAWQKARLVTRRVYELTKQGAFAKDYGLSSQIQRSAVSIMCNIAEGFERFNSGEFHQFLSIAKASCAEVRCQLYIALDVGYINEQTTFSELMSLTEETGKLVGGLRAYVEKYRDQRKIT